MNVVVIELLKIMILIFWIEWFSLVINVWIVLKINFVDLFVVWFNFLLLIVGMDIDFKFIEFIFFSVFFM